MHSSREERIFYREISRSKNGKVVVVVVVLLLLLLVLSFLRSRLQGKRRDSLSFDYITGMKGRDEQRNREGVRGKKESNLVPKMYNAKFKYSSTERFGMHLCILFGLVSRSCSVTFLEGKVFSLKLRVAVTGLLHRNTLRRTLNISNLGLFAKKKCLT